MTSPKHHDIFGICCLSFHHLCLPLILHPLLPQSALQVHAGQRLVFLRTVSISS